MSDIQEMALEIIEAMSEMEGYSMRGNKFANQIYRIAHVALGHCENPHHDWLDELKKTHAELRANRII